jgi:hypothetical protein
MSPLWDFSRDWQMRQTQGQLQLSGGDIRPRTPHQVVTVRSYETECRLLWSDSASSEAPQAARKGGGPMVRNLLGAQLLYAVGKTDEGLYVVKDLANGEAAAASSATPGDVDQQVSGLAGRLSSATDQAMNYRVYVGNDNNGTQRGEEAWIIRLLIQAKFEEILTEPNTYLAILEEFPEVENQIEAVNYKKQLHVVIGKW